MIRTDRSAVFHRFLYLPYPSIESGVGVWLTTVDGRRVLDACSGGEMVACLGHGVRELAAATAELIVLQCLVEPGHTAVGGQSCFPCTAAIGPGISLHQMLVEKLPGGLTFEARGAIHAEEHDILR